MIVFSGITLGSISGLIISSGVGVAVGLITLAIEVFFYKNKKNNEVINVSSAPTEKSEISVLE